MDSTDTPDPVSGPFTSWQATLHGLDPREVRLWHDEDNRAFWIYLDGRGVGIRIDMKYPAALVRDRQGLLELAARAAQAAQEIERIQHEGEGNAE